MDDLDDIAVLLRETREARLLTQERLSAMSGVPQSTIGDIERGKRLPKLEVLDRLLAPMGLQPAVAFEPRLQGLDQEIDALLRLPAAKRLGTVTTEGLSPFLPLMRLAGTGAVLGGSLAAVAQGAPVPVAWMDFHVPRRPDVLNKVSDALKGLFAWHDVLGSARPDCLLDPEVDPTSTWLMPRAELRLHIVDGPVVTDATVLIDTSNGPQPLPLIPLWCLEAEDRTTRRVLDRMRERASQAADS